MKKTPFYDIHVSSGAKIVDFGGYAMPVQYSGIIEEHSRVREAAGVFDVSHMGEFEIRGNDAEEFLQRLTINDVTKLFSGKAQYSAMVYEDGGLVDDLLVYHCGDYYMLVVNAANKEKDLTWIKDHLTGDVDVRDVSDEIALLAVQGPKSIAILQKLSDIDLSEIKYYHFVNGTIAGREMIISRTGYTGELGFELYFRGSPEECSSVWNKIMDAGKDEGVGPAGLGARDTLRLEMGYLLYGNDIDKTTNPFEAGMGWITKLDKGEFIGGESLKSIKAEGISRRLYGMVVKDDSMAKRAIPRHGYEIHIDGNRIGTVTSGTLSPSLMTSIAMGYVGKEHAKEGNTVEILIRDKAIPFELKKPPFLTRS